MNNEYNYSNFDFQTEVCTSIYKEVMQLPPEIRLSLALTLLDEASETLNFSPDEINELRTSTYEKVGKFYK